MGLGYQNQLNKRLQFFEEGRHSDVILTCEGRNINSHWFVLAENSRVFETMFENEGFKESRTKHVTIHNSDYVTLQSVIRFLYTGSIELTPSNVLNVFNLANQYDVTPLRDACGDYLFEKIDTKVAISPLWMAGNLFQATKLTSMCLEFCLKNFTKSNSSQMSKEAGFFDGDYNVITQLLSNKDLNVPHERDVMFAIVDWVMFDQEERGKFMFKLLSSCLRTEFLSNDDVLEALTRDGQLMNDVTRSGFCQFAALVSQPIFQEPFLAVRTSTVRKEELMCVISQSSRKNIGKLPLSYPDKNFSIEFQRHPNQYTYSSNEEFELLECGHTNHLIFFNYQNNKLSRIVNAEKELREIQDNFLDGVKFEKLHMISPNKAVAFSISEEKQSLCMWTLRRIAFKGWKVDKSRRLTNIFIKKKNYRYSVVYKNYLVIFEPGESQVNIIDICYQRMESVVRFSFGTEKPLKLVSQKYKIGRASCRERV